MSHFHRLAFVSAFTLLVGCGSTSSSGTGGTGGEDTGGGPGSGGSATGGKTGTGGSPGSGGSPGTGGSTGGSPGSGGGPGTGGSTGGSGGSTGGAGGMADAGVDGPTSGTGGAGGGGGTTLDQCFANLPALTGRWQISTKSSADGGTKIRVALVRDPDSIGTSGTIPWTFVRFGIERGTNSACVTDAAQLKYMGSLHNCMDKATATANGITYTIAGPDRAKASVGATGAAAFPAVMLTGSACKSSDGNACGSGGPCQ